MARLAVLGFAVCLFAIAACDDSSMEQAEQGASVRGVGCSEAVTSRVDPRWRAESVGVGSFGLYGGGTDIERADRWDDSTFWTKIPVIVAGHRPVTLRVAPQDRRRVGLTYAAKTSSPATSKDGRRGLATAPRALRFTPCRDRSPTAWPGGLVLASRETVSFDVRLDGARWSRLTILNPAPGG